MSELPVPGVRAGHWTGAGTGVTVIMLPDGTTGSAEVRGGAPATREIELLSPRRVVDQVDAVVLTGGSAFGLATADGVMSHLADRGRGYATAAGPVPIVPTAAIYDLVESDGRRPGPDEGRLAAIAADDDVPFATGRVGAGTGATVGKWRGREFAVPGGLGVAHARVGDAVVVVVAVANAVGDVVGADGRVLAGSTAPPDAESFPTPRPFQEGNTTLVVALTDGRLDKNACELVAGSCHDGIARALHPAHTRFDGDLSIALATGTVDVHLDRLRATVIDTVAAAIRHGATSGAAG